MRYAAEFLVHITLPKISHSVNTENLIIHKLSNILYKSFCDYEFNHKHRLNLTELNDALVNRTYLEAKFSFC